MARLTPHTLRARTARSAVLNKPEHDEALAAFLRYLVREIREAQEKQETPESGISEASTDSNTITGGVKWSLNPV